MAVHICWLFHPLVISTVPESLELQTFLGVFSIAVKTGKERGVTILVAVVLQERLKFSTLPNDVVSLYS